MNIVAMLSERIDDKEIEEDVANINDNLGELADINEMDDRIANLKRQNNHFDILIGQRTLKFDYRADDPIFNLMGPAVQGLAPPINACNCCGETIKKEKDAKGCNFCALSYCGQCCKKKRDYPKSNPPK